MKAVVNIPVDAQLSLQIFEVDAAAWISRDTVITSIFNEDGFLPPLAPPIAPVLQFDAYEIEKTLHADDVSPVNLSTESTDLTNTTNLKKVVYRVKQLQSSLLPDGTFPLERISTGCRFALREWLTSTE